MKAIRVYRFGPPEVMILEDVPTPQPGPEEVLVRVRAAGLNYADLVLREGKSSIDPRSTAQPEAPNHVMLGTTFPFGDR